MGIREKIEVEVLKPFTTEGFREKSFDTVGIRENLNLRFSKSYTMTLLWVFMGASGRILVAPQMGTQLSSEQRQLSQSKEEK